MSTTVPGTSAAAGQVPSTVPAVELDNVSVEFPRRTGPVLRKLDLRLEAGEQLIVFGPSGAGKSTLLQLVTGTIPHSVVAQLSGSVRVGGTDTADTGVAALSRCVGVLAQDPSSAVCLPDVEQELALPLENRAVDPEAISGRIDAALRAVNAGGLRLRKTSALSGGEGQRVALAASLIAEPEVLLLDEPTSMLDGEGIASVREAIERAVDQYRPAVVLVEHRMDEYAGRRGLAGLPGRAVVLNGEGEILLDGPTPQVLTEAAAELQARGCWLPLETELQAVFGCPGGLEAETVRNGLKELAAAHPTGASVEGHPHSTDAPVLQAAGLSVGRPQAGRRRRRSSGPAKAGFQEGALLANVDLALRPGEIVALLGANGTGKTSLLLTLAGLLEPAAGQVAGPRPAMVFQNPEHQFVAGTVRGELAYGLAAGSEPVVDRLLRQHRLEHLADQNPFRLSGGEKRRLSVAAMLAHHRPALLADEPCFGLDRRAAIAMMDAFRAAAAAGRAIMFSTHDLRTAATVAHRAVVIAGGSVIADGPVFEVLAQREVLARAGLALPALLEWVLETFETPHRMRAVLSGLDAFVPLDGEGSRP
ncbi:putative HMP/thiamine import ATP-binding protein YkoD [Zafaria cholistanensis]|uniref:Putative HMP/thiamine import ATP-binding protein YkoD n=1 Tax=Zafaria cholistanensis TaxID=1682741 RepID=A0A5A7NUW3_9MICC|nr:ABC transporter ATP-binding protein [Zafaria cholistanensis]GER24092.1 putative HMP/thiamine import ATP-binding protein YkoD [Zafaria cholistanensis]